MKQIERIKTMEQHLDRASQAVMKLSTALDDYAEAQEALRELSAYYGSDEWKQDFADDEQGQHIDEHGKGGIGGRVGGTAEECK